MNMKSKNIQAQRSRQMIVNALISLLQIHAFKDISVTQICQEAQVVRQTFYRNFDSKIEILELHLNEIMTQHQWSSADSKDVYLTAKRFFDYIYPHRFFLKWLEENNLFYLFNKATIAKVTELPNYVDTIKTSRNEVYISNFIASTLSSILLTWVKNEFAEPTEVLAGFSKIFLAGLVSSINIQDIQ